jgi:hypothetical protein
MDIIHVAEKVGSMEGTRFKTAQEWVTAVKAMSTKQGHRAGVCRKTNGGKRKTMRCWTVTSKRALFDPNDPKNKPFLCGFQAVVRKSGASKYADAPWTTDMKKSNFEHHALCCSKPVMSVREIIDDEAFCNACTNSVQAKALTKTLVGAGTDIAAHSVKLHNLYRAKNLKKDAGEATFEADWARLPTWGREFKRLNPGSTFALKQDAEGRFKYCFVAPKQAVDAAVSTGINFSGIDWSVQYLHTHAQMQLTHMHQCSQGAFQAPAI